MPPDSRVHVGTAGVVVKDGALLMVKRTGTGAYAGDGHGTWSVPGGWLDFGEYPEDAAAREVKEETGVTVSPAMQAGYVCAWNNHDDDEATPGEFQVVTLFVICDYKEGEPTVTEPDKCGEVAWVPIAEVDQRPLFAPLADWWPRYVQVVMS